MLKSRKLKLRIDRETIRTLAGAQLAAPRGGLPQVTEGDVECPTTANLPTCDGHTCVTACASDCITCGRTCREDCW